MRKRTMNQQRRPAGRSAPPARATLDAMTAAANPNAQGEANRRTHGRKGKGGR